MFRSNNLIDSISVEEGTCDRKKDSAFPNAPFSLTAVASEPLSPDAAKTTAPTVRTIRVRCQEAMIPKKGLRSPFVMSVSTQVDEGYHLTTFSFR